MQDDVIIMNIRSPVRSNVRSNVRFNVRFNVRSPVRSSVRFNVSPPLFSYFRRRIIILHNVFKFSLLVYLFTCVRGVFLVICKQRV